MSAKGRFLWAMPTLRRRCRVGRLHLTTSTFGNNSAFHIPPVPDSSNGFEIWFNYEISDTTGGNVPADGFSFSYGGHPLRDDLGAG